MQRFQIKPFFAFSMLREKKWQINKLKTRTSLIFHFPSFNSIFIWLDTFVSYLVRLCNKSRALLMTLGTILET